MTKQKNNTKHYGSMLLLSVLFVVILFSYAQQPPPAQKPINPNMKIIEMQKADILYKLENFDATILKNNVVFYHDGAYMYCDSAYLHEKTNSFEAFGNVRMEQGDTIFVYGDYLNYNGNTKFAKLRYNIRLEDKQATLFTDSLDYDRVANLGYYFDGGLLVDEENELSSFWGQYDLNTKEALFNDSVKLVNPDYTIYTEELKYNTVTKIADIIGPSTIVSDSGTVYTDRGWYNTITDDSQLLDRSRVVSKDGSKFLTGDTIYHNQKTGIGKVYGDMFLQDSLRKAIIGGNYGYYDDNLGYAMATDSAYAIEYSDRDSLFLHADTLKMITDSLDRQMIAYYNVRFFRNDIQGVCDSLQYFSKDSLLSMYKNPVIWNGNYQLLGNQIDIYLNDSTIEKANVKEYSLGILKRPVENQFNQLTGRDMTATFENGNLKRLLVEGNAESLYYILSEDSTVIGLNKTESAFLSMDIKDDKVEKLKLWNSTKAQTTPLSQLDPKSSTLKGFVWLDYMRPVSAWDIFRSSKRKSEDNIAQPKRFRRPDVEIQSR
ncbi:MAG: OstA-like protein [Dysgonamonadaceae bacterium]|jgi:lipopolysaccharide export system protein LptA|nr:OstA-like protein [Dysgonamonadaceae bacterium]MDD3309604.1 OstA-like protein [Dysgonamonadaceae bacterium]MDD4398843.1 OstA-like protein [Dysgonamonadaceae bacterium]MEA5082205.1 OstA-like protein [Dysgonamonadaceae bacterium]